ncbi:MAG: hypothetical protein DMG28_06370 [Acidobacteria bacterium]|nr:MAG: hypothetical protein DMG28_06370 [Acidobacteriota bacterium]
MAITDSPPANATVLAFDLSVTGVVLNPGNVSLLSAQTKVDIKRLEAENAALSSVAVPTGIYNSITISLANPVLTFKNDTGGTLANCPAGQVCQLRPSIATNVTLSTGPFPLTIFPNTPVGLLFDVNLSNVLSPTLGIDFTAAGGITVSLLPAVQPTGQLTASDDVLGTVTSMDVVNQQFVLSTRQDNLLISVDGNTVFTDFDEAQLGNTFGGVLPGELLEVDLALLGSGTLLATRVELQDKDSTKTEVEGVVVSVDAVAQQFKIAVVQVAPTTTGLDVGNLATVSLGPSALPFGIDNDGLSTAGFIFSAVRDLQPGQGVQVRASSFTTLQPNFIVADRVQLRMSRFTATVLGTPSGNSFSANNLPSLLTTTGITQISVQTSTQTQFEGGITGVSGLGSGSSVSLRGLLFKQAAGNPVFVAEKVRKR